MAPLFPKDHYSLSNSKINVSDVSHIVLMSLDSKFRAAVDPSMDPSHEIRNGIKQWAGKIYKMTTVRQHVGET